MDDNLAILVGRVILAWGVFDTQLNFTIEDLGKHGSEPFAFEGRYKQRMRRLRSLLVESGAEAGTQSLFDRFCTSAGDLFSKRSNLAHGVVSSADGIILVFDYETAAAASALVKPDWLTMTEPELAALPDRILNAKGDLGRWHSEISQRFYARESH